MVVKIAPGPVWGMDGEGINWLKAFFNDGVGSGRQGARDGILGSVLWDAVAFTRADFMRVLFVGWRIQGRIRHLGV